MFNNEIESDCRNLIDLQFDLKNRFFSVDKIFYDIWLPLVMHNICDLVWRFLRAKQLKNSFLNENRKFSSTLSSTADHDKTANMQTFSDQLVGQWKF